MSDEKTYHESNIAFTIEVSFDGNVVIKERTTERLAENKGFPPEGKIKKIIKTTEVCIISFEGSPGCTLITGGGGAYWDCS